MDRARAKPCDLQESEVFGAIDGEEAPVSTASHIYRFVGDTGQRLPLDEQGVPLLHSCHIGVQQPSDP